MAVEAPRQARQPATLRRDEVIVVALGRALVDRLARLASAARAEPMTVMPRGAPAVAAILAILLTAVLLDALVAGWARQLPPPAVHVAALVTLLGQGWLSMVPAIAVALCLGWMSFAAASRRRRARLAVLAEKAMFVASALIIAALIGTVLKHLVGRVRPPHGGTPHPFDFEPFSTAASRASFPSGHSLTVAALFVAVTAIAPRWRAPLAILALAVFVSRIVVEAHYTSDVVAGACVGALGASIALVLFRRARIGLRDGPGS
jgi:undecaprenyl-diphosphatase